MSPVTRWERTLKPKVWGRDLALLEEAVAVALAPLPRPGAVSTELVQTGGGFSSLTVQVRAVMTWDTMKVPTPESEAEALALLERYAKEAEAALEPMAQVSRWVLVLVPPLIRDELDPEEVDS